jgi:hypothetical protein
MNSSLFATLPNFATKNPSPSFSNFSATFSIAELLFETTRTLFFANKRLAIMLRIV